MLTSSSYSYNSIRVLPSEWIGIARVMPIRAADPIKRDLVRRAAVA